MILIANSVQSVNPYLYKLILAITVSNMSLEVEAKSQSDETVFDTLMLKGMPYFDHFFKEGNGRDPKNVAEVFNYFIKQKFPLKSSEICLKLSEDLFSTPLGGIMRRLLLTPNMDILLYKFLLQKLSVVKIGKADWLEIKKSLVDFCVSSIPLVEEKYGLGSNLQSIIRIATGWYVSRHYSDIFRIINKTGMNAVINEDGLTMGHFHTFSDSEVKSDIDLEKILVDIYNLNTALYYHYFVGTGIRVMFYDAISKYKMDLLNEKAAEIDNIYMKHWNCKPSQGAVAIDKNERDPSTKNSGTNLKYFHNDELLDIIKPIVKDGLHPSAVDEYARQIFLHVQSKITGSASPVFKIAPQETVGDGYYGSTYVFKGPKDQETLQDLIVGAVAINKLLSHIRGLGLNIFDLDSRLFRDYIYTYRFKSIEECLFLFQTIYDLENRPESDADLEMVARNVLPHNDEVVSDIKKRSISMDLSINCADITKSLGELSTLNSKKVKGKAKSASEIMYQKLYDTALKINKGLKSVSTTELRFGSGSINLLSFMQSVKEVKTFVEAANQPVFKDNGIWAPLAVESVDVDFYPTPSLNLIDYCAGSRILEGIVSFFIDRSIDDSKDMPLQVYRNCSFFIALYDRMSKLFESIISTMQEYNNNKGNKYLGVFDMYNFAFDNLLICSIGSLKSLDAVRAVRDEIDFDIYKTKSISISSIDSQLVVGYSLFLAFFEEALLAMKELAAIYYYDFSNRLNGANSLMGNEAFMKQISERLAGEPRVNLESFVKFKSFCDKNSAGFLIRRGKFIFVPDKGYLLDRGYWVLLLSDGSYHISQVTEHDNFTKVVEVMI